MFRHQLMNALCLGSYDRLIWPHCDGACSAHLMLVGSSVAGLIWPHLTA